MIDLYMADIFNFLTIENIWTFEEKKEEEKNEILKFPKLILET